MENASKALIIAGEILIGLMVLSLMLYVFTTFGKFSANMHESIAEAKTMEFNNNFYNYEHRTNITATEIVTIINFVKHANDSRELSRNETSSEYYIRVFIDDKDVFNNSQYIDDDDDYDDNAKFGNVLKGFLKENNIYYFSCNAKLKPDLEVDYETYKDDIKVNENTHLVTEIRFHKIDASIISATSST